MYQKVKRLEGKWKKERPDRSGRKMFFLTKKFETQVKAIENERKRFFFLEIGLGSGSLGK